MIDNNPENGYNPKVGDTEAEPTRNFQTATVVAEPAEPTTEPSPSSPGIPPQIVDPMADTVPTSEAASNQSEAIDSPPEATAEAEFSSELNKFRQTFEEIQAEFIGEPRVAVEKAETLIDGLMSALHEHLQRIHGNVKTETDTEQLRVAMLSYRELFASLGGRRAT